MRRCAILFPLLLSSCILGNSGRDEVIRIVREFNADLRWGRSELVLQRLSEKARARFANELLALGDDLEFLDEELLGLDIQRGQKGHDQAQCRVELSWTSRRTGVVERTTIVEHWEAKGPSWVVQRLLRVRGAPLPLFEEPAAQKAAPPVPPPT